MSEISDIPEIMKKEYSKFKKVGDKIVFIKENPDKEKHQELVKKLKESCEQVGGEIIQRGNRVGCRVGDEIIELSVHNKIDIVYTKTDERLEVPFKVDDIKVKYKVDTNGNKEKELIIDFNCGKLPFGSKEAAEKLERLKS